MYFLFIISIYDAYCCWEFQISSFNTWKVSIEEFSEWYSEQIFFRNIIVKNCAAIENFLHATASVGEESNDFFTFTV